MSETPGFGTSDSKPDSSGRRSTWPVGVPPLWLTRPAIKRPRRSETESAPLHPGPAPRYLRVARVFVGIALLVLAWAGFLLVAGLATYVLQTPLTLHPTRQILLSALAACGMLWAAIIAACCVVAGSFSLALAVTKADWE